MKKESNLATEEITSDDKLFAALAYALSPLVPILLLFIEDHKDRPFIQAHNVQALIAGIALWIIIVPITVGCGSIAWFVMLYWAYRAYQGEIFKIPLIGDFVEKQGWA
jgi:uncharacterized membrane protein